jgi:phosphoglycolate phosphatase
MTIRAVLFDLDGTLVNTLPDIGGSMNQVLEDLGLPTHGMPAYKAYVGEGVSRLVERALPPDRAALRADAEAAFRLVYADRLTDQSVPYPGIAELLDGLRAQGLRLAVCSNKPQAMTERVVATLLGRWRFEGVEG